MKIELLDKPFDKSQIKERPGRGGQMLSYVETPAVIRRLNEAFDYEWDFEIEQFQLTENEAVVLAKLTVYHEKGSIVKMQFGSSALAKGKDGTVYNAGDALKAAASDALKKCATLLGIGLHLYEDEVEPKPEKPFDPRDAFEKCVAAFGRKAVEDELRRYGIESLKDLPDNRDFWAELWRKLAAQKKENGGGT